MLNIKPLGQRDPKWASEILGFNKDTYTIGGYGCLITSICVACNYYGKSETPLTINKKLKDAKGFAANNGFYIWGAIEKVFPDINEEWLGKFPDPLTNTQMDAIKTALKNGYPVMVEIDFQPETAKPDMHFVLLIGYDANDEDNLTMMDPWTGSIGSLKMYLKASKPTARKSIEQIVIYKGQIPQIPDENLEDKISELQDQLAKALQRASDWEDKYNKALISNAEEVKGKNKQIGDIQQALSSTSGSLLAATEQIKTLKQEKDAWLKKESEVWEPLKEELVTYQEDLKQKILDYNELEIKYLANLNKKPRWDLFKAFIFRG